MKIAQEEVRTGWYKSDKAIQVVDGKKNIQIPIQLLDKKIITSFKVDEIKDIIRLYSLYKPLASIGGLDYNSIYAVNNKNNNGVAYLTRFGGGFSRVIKGKKAFRVENAKTYINNTDYNIDINKYIGMKLFKLKPVIVEYDAEDKELNQLKSEIFKGLVQFSNEDSQSAYITTELKENQKIIWILEPIYHVKNEVYKEYLKNRTIAREKAVEIFGVLDESTRDETIKKLIYNGQLFEFVEYMYLIV